MGLRLKPWLAKAQDVQIRERVDELMELGGIAAHADRLVGELSHGDQRATEIMMTLALKPRLLLLDEPRSEEHTSELQSLMRISYAVFCLKKKKKVRDTTNIYTLLTRCK